MTDAKARHYRFGRFRLDLRTRELHRDDVAVALTAKAFEVLRVLVEQRERVVGRDELLSTVWAGRVVEENNLTQAIAALRRAFGTDAHDHQYILTVPGRGYRFVADLDEDAGAEATAPPPQASIAAAPPRDLRPGRISAVLLLACALAVGAWWWLQRGPRPAPPAHPAQPLALAVLPFVPLPADARDELLELGLADTLITRIGGATALRVSPLSSSRHFAGAARDPVDAARQLGVAYLVDGSTQRQGERIRVNVRLLTADGRPLWSGSFAAPAARVFTLQDDIADALANALAVTVPAAARRSPCDGEHAGAYRAYLSGQYRMGRPSSANARQALADYRRALDLDPTCARAYAAMAMAWRALVITADLDPRDAFPRAQALVDRAIAIDPQLPEAHLAQGWIHFWYDWDWAAAEAAFQRAIALNPSLADAHFGYAHLLANIGRRAEATARAREAMALDPLSPVINAIGGFFVAPPGEAQRYMARALEIDPDYWLALLMRGFGRTASGDVDGGLADLDRARTLCDDCSHALTVRGMLDARIGRADDARRLLQAMQAREHAGYWPASSLATVHAALGEPEAALDQLERALRERDVRMAFLLADEGVRWGSLRGMPRYAALMARMDFEGLRTHAPESANTSAVDRSSR